jgi:hypothetical protein
VITFATLQSALVVNVGDPNNSSSFYLAQESDGKPQFTFLGASSGDVAVDWLDAPPDQPAGLRQLAVHRARLDQGRWLLLGDRCVLDTHTLKSFQFGTDAGVYLNVYKGPLGLSPDQHSFVRLASDNSQASLPVLVVFDFVADTSYVLPIDRSRMRYNEWEDIDALWIVHYFEWQQSEGAHDRLAPRADAVPMPYRGRLALERDGSYGEYTLMPVKPELRDKLVGFLEHEFRAKLIPADRSEITETLRVDGRNVYILRQGDHLSVFMDRGTDSHLVAEIARRFDARLKTGEFDGLFLTAPAQ